MNRKREIVPNQVTQPLAAEDRKHCGGSPAAREPRMRELLRDAGGDPDAFRDFYERYSEQISATSGDGPPTPTRHSN